MTPAAGGRGGLGWAILIAALAVPGFLFYNWWSHLKAEHDHSISAKASKRADGGMFQTPPPSTARLINPMASSTNVPAGYPPAASAARLPFAPPVTMPARTTPAAKMPVATTPAATIPAATPPASSSATIAGRTPPPAASAGPVSSTATFVLSRDPMMSPLDAVRLQEAALAEEERLRELNHHARPAKKAAQRPIESRIELQGIVGQDGNNMAMINGLTVSAGESLAVAGYPGKVKIVKITASAVTLDYKGRKFKLSAE